MYAVDVLEDDKNAAMLVNRCKTTDSVVEVFDEEYRKDQVVFDLDLVVAVVKHLVDCHDFLMTTELEWEHRTL